MVDIPREFTILFYKFPANVGLFFVFINDDLPELYGTLLSYYRILCKQVPVVKGP